MDQKHQLSLFTNEEIGTPEKPSKQRLKGEKTKMANTNSRKINEEFITKTEKRALKDGAVLGPCLRIYKERYEHKTYSHIQLLNNLTEPLLSGAKETEAIIRHNMDAKWQDDSDKENKIVRSVNNSLRRSAGTNYQALVSYALARYLAETNSAWCISHPVPKEFQHALSIKFTAGIPVQPEEIEEIAIDTDERVLLSNSETETNTVMEEDNEKSPAVEVQPDVDVLLRNFSWKEQEDKAEPVVMLSLKTSLVDRAGMAARWKIYFDLATHPCCHQQEEDCAYGRLGIQMENASKYDIHHGIVTANIYKINFHEVRHHIGELSSKQTQSNTYMFELKLTTRDDGIAITPKDWKQFQSIADVLEQISARNGLPR